MKVYTAKDVSRLLDLSVAQIRSYARAGFLEPGRGPRGEYRFSFQDLVLLRTAKGLIAARIPPVKVRRALRRLRNQLPIGRPLTGVQIRAEGDRVVIRDGEALWSADSGQGLFNFEVADLARKVASHTRRVVKQALRGLDEMDADEWFQLGSDLEATTPTDAREAYRRCLELEPNHTDARVNLGRLLHELGRYASAEAHYRLSLVVAPNNATALFNLGVCLEDTGKSQDALDAYRRSIESDPGFADAYFNAARLFERLGDGAAALRHLQIYRKLTDSH